MGKVLAYVLWRRRDEVFLKLKDLLELFVITRFYTDDWGPVSAISILAPCYWKTKHAENRAQTFNATDANQVAGAEDHLFFKA